MVRALVLDSSECSDPALQTAQPFKKGFEEEHSAKSLCSDDDEYSLTSAETFGSSVQLFDEDEEGNLVRFEENQVYFVESFMEDYSNHLNLWYSKQEMVEMRQQYITDARQIARSNKQSDSAILKTFHECSKGESCLDGELVEELRVYLRDETQTGLERMAARQIYNDKKFRRCTLYDSVFSIQTRHRKNYERMSSLMRFACESISFSSVLFAHQLAMAASDEASN